MKAKNYDEYTDEEIKYLIEYFKCEEKSSIFITFSNFLSDTLNIENLPTYFFGWEKVEYTLDENTFTDYVCYKNSSGYFLYVVNNNTAKVGEFLGKDYLTSLRNNKFRSVVIPYPTTLSNFIKICKSNFIELYWNIK